jgi:hypothetical protein
MANEVKLTFAGDSRSLDQTFTKVGAGARTMGGQVDAAGTRAQGSFKRMGLAASAFGVAAGAVLFRFGKDALHAFTDAEEQENKLEDAFARFPKIADTNLDRLHKLNTALAQKTKFDDDAYASGEAILAQFKLTGAQLETITPLLGDYAAKTGSDLPTAADKLGRAFLGNTKALKELGINYKSTGNQATDVKNITALLNQQVGGFAEKQGKTAAGQAAILDNRFGEMKETVGQKLLPVMLKLADVGIKTIDWVSKNARVVGPLAAVIGAVVVAQWAWNIAMAANPIGLVVIAVAALAAGLVLFFTKTEVGRKIVAMLWDEIQVGWKILRAIGAWFAGPFVDFWVNGWHGITRHAAMAADFIRGIPGKIGGAFKAVFGFITAPFRAAFNFVSDAWNHTIGRLHWSVPGWVPGIGGNSIGAPQLPHFHSGGRVPGLPGQEVLSVLQSGETVSPIGAGAGGTPIIIRSGGSRFDDLLVQILREAIRAGGGNVQEVLGV